MGAAEAYDERATLCLYTAAIDACEKAGDGAQALRLMEQMWREHGVAPDEVACGAAISACRKAGMVAETMKLLSFMVKNKLTPNLGVYNTVLGALCGRPETLDKAMDVLLFMQNCKTGGLKPNTQSYAQVIIGLADNLRAREALSLLQEMRKAGLRPDVLTCAKVIRACEKTQRWKEALQLLDEMRKDDYDFYELRLLDQVCFIGGSLGSHERMRMLSIMWSVMAALGWFGG
jgi:pentatricopeptide repeat protein